MCKSEGQICRKAVEEVGQVRGQRRSWLGVMDQSSEPSLWERNLWWFHWGRDDIKKRVLFWFITIFDTAEILIKPLSLIHQYCPPPITGI